MKRLTLFVFACSVLAAGCGGSPTAPTVTTINCSVASTAGCTTEVFIGTLSPTPAGATTFNIDAHNFTVTQAGTATFVLNSAGPPATITIGLGLGTPNAGGCAGIAATPISAGPTVYVSNVGQGSLCVAAVDIGNLLADITYQMTVVHP